MDLELQEFSEIYNILQKKEPEKFALPLETLLANEDKHKDLIRCVREKVYAIYLESGKIVCPHSARKSLVVTEPETNSFNRREFIHNQLIDFLQGGYKSLNILLPQNTQSFAKAKEQALGFMKDFAELSMTFDYTTQVERHDLYIKLLTLELRLNMSIAPKEDHEKLLILNMQQIESIFDNPQAFAKLEKEGEMDLDTLLNTVAIVDFRDVGKMFMCTAMSNQYDPLHPRYAPCNSMVITDFEDFANNTQEVLESIALNQRTNFLLYTAQREGENIADINSQRPNLYKQLYTFVKNKKRGDLVKKLNSLQQEYGKGASIGYISGTVFPDNYPTDVS